MVSTAHSIQGTARALRAYNPQIHMVAVEPAEPAVLSGKPSGSHKVEGVGIGFVPPLWKPAEVDEILPVTTDDAKEMARRLAREEAIFAGPSTGANVVAALRIAERLGPHATGRHDSCRFWIALPQYRRVPDLIRAQCAG